MASDRTSFPSRGASRPRLASALLALTHLTMLPMTADAAGKLPESQAGGKASLAATPSHFWRDGATIRPLTLQSELQADFSPGPQGKSSVLRPSTGVLKDVSPALQSPVFRDESGRLRALPGGVLVVLAAPLADDAATALIASHDARAVRRIGERTWLVESAAGLPSLELANRLAATGAFAAAQPNWWMERTRK
ncbi:MAG: hypothetical protein RJA99_1809 [Pseudomonadota bacterium]|jgi:hypothetical protein